VCDAVPVMDKAAEKAGLERLLGTASTLGLQQLDDMQTKEDSAEAGSGDQAGGDDKAKQPSGAIDRPDAGPSSFCVSVSRRAASILDRTWPAPPIAAEPAPRRIAYCPRTVSPSRQMLT